MSSLPNRESSRTSAEEDGRHDNDDDAVFHFADKTAGFLLAFGLGYIVLQAVPAGFWIAIGCLVIGAGAKIIFRAL